MSLENTFKALSDVNRREILSLLKKNSMTAGDLAAKLGNPQVANIIMIGFAARFITNISHDAWISAIEKNVPEKFIDLNIEAFDKALNDEL